MIIIIVAVVIFSAVFLQRFIYIKFAFVGIKYSCKFTQNEVNEGDIFFIVEEIENNKILPLPVISSVLSLPSGFAFADKSGNIIDENSAFCFASIGWRKKITRNWRVKAIKRGRFSLENITVNARDLFGLATISQDFSENSSVLILPTAYKSNEIVSRQSNINRAVLNSYCTDPFNIIKIAPYTYSEPLNKINWKASAKSGSLMINCEQPSVSARISVILDVNKHAQTETQIEKNIKICASLGRIFSRDCEINLLTNAEFPENYNNALIIKGNNNYVKTREFIFDLYEREFRRFLAEIRFSVQDNKNNNNLDKLKLQKNFGKIILIRGGQIYDENEKIIFV